VADIVQSLFEQQAARRRELEDNIRLGVRVFIDAHAAWPIIPIEPPLVLFLDHADPPTRITLESVREQRTLSILLSNGQLPQLESVWWHLEPWLRDLLPRDDAALKSRRLVGKALESERELVRAAVAECEQQQEQDELEPRLMDVARVVARLKNAPSTGAIRRWLDRHPELTEGFAIRRNAGRRPPPSRTNLGHAQMSETESEIESETPQLGRSGAPH